MTCIDFIIGYVQWLDAGQTPPLSESALQHQSTCFRCSSLSRRMLENDARFKREGRALPEIDIPRMADRLVAAFKPMKISLPLSTSLRPAAYLAVPALCLWGISLLVPAGPSAALQLLLVFGAAFLLLRKILVG